MLSISSNLAPQQLFASVTHHRIIPTPRLDRKIQPLAMHGGNNELIQRVAGSIREGYSDWKSSMLNNYNSPIGKHFIAGFVRNTIDSALCNVVASHAKQPTVRKVLTHLSKTLGLASQISVLAPGAFSLKMAAIIGIGGSISQTVRSLARLLGHAYLAKSLVAIAKGDQAALAALVSSVAGAYAGNLLGNLSGNLLGNHISQPKQINHAQSETGNNKLLNQLLIFDHKASNVVDQYLHFNFLIKHLLPAINLAHAQPALTARVILKD